MVKFVMIVEGMVWMATALLMSSWLPHERLSPGGGPLIMIGHAVFFALCGCLSFYYHNLYDLRRVKTLRAFGHALPSALGFWLLLWAGGHAVAALLAWASLVEISGVLWMGVGTGLILPTRVALYAFLKSGRFAKRVIILGTGEWAKTIAEEIQASPQLNYRLLGHVDDGSQPLRELLQPTSHPVLGPLENLVELIKRFEPDVIVVALVERRLRLPVLDLLNARVDGVWIEDGAELYERCTEKLAIDHLVPSHLLFSRDFVKSPWLMATRRALSCTVAAAGLILSAPLMGLIALAIKLDSQGSVFFVQDRAGLYGQPFRLMKFRTMHPPAPSVDPTQRHWASDLVRITRVGKWLRRLYLDELPQFLNILFGEMDLVGPRPEIFDNVKTMSEQIPYYALRTTVRPGLTGWAQINQGYAVSPEEVAEKMRYDLYYVKHMSLWFDLRIGIDTFKNILFRRGT